MNAPHSPNFSRMLEGEFTVPVPVNDSYVIHSLNKQFARTGMNRGYSLKYVMAGEEHYAVNGQRQTVGAGKLLLVNHGSETEVQIQAKQAVEGLCVYLNPELVSGVWTTLHQDPEQLLENIAPATVLPGIPEVVLRAGQEQLGQQVAHLATILKAQPANTQQLSEELFFELAAELCRFQGKCQGQMASLAAQKKTTREELFRRLLLSRDFLHDNLTAPLSLAQLADAATLSEYHFLRSFKAAFGESPYQYLLRQRLELAKQLLAQQQQPVTEIALACGFQDVQAFTKLFRRATGMAPTVFARKVEL